MSMEVLGHLANVVYVVALLIKDVVWMRCFLIAGSLVDLAYGLAVGEDILWVNVFWSSIWIVVNGAQLAILCSERISLCLSEEENRIYGLSFAGVAKVDFAKLMKIAKWITYEPNTLILEGGIANDRLIVVCSGVARICDSSDRDIYLKDGNFIGEMSYITGNATSVSVSALTEVRAAFWNSAELKKLLCKYPSLESDLKTSFNVDLAKKLAMNR
jgi:CRP-like cAMP-binding protein